LGDHWFAALALQLVVPLGLDRYLPTPVDNPLDRGRAAVGRRLFFDKSLSRDRTVACSTCHDPKRAFADDKPLAVGIAGRTGKRRAPTLLNRGYGSSFFWDGRAATLEEQVLKPISHPDEMDLAVEDAAARVGTPPAEMARALATYVRTILAGDSPYDRYVQGDRAALNPLEQAGLRLFRGKAGCTGCHVGPNLTDERFHNTGLPGDDPGRSAVTQRAEDRGAFKTPTLRQVASRAPYMHDGSLATLDDVVEHYDKGGRESASLDPEMRRLSLSPEEKRALVAFLRTLSGTVREGL
jgi:cytochrome c peroxidase